MVDVKRKKEEKILCVAAAFPLEWREKGAFMTCHIRCIARLAVLACLTAAWIFPAHAATGPEESVRMLQRAVDARNLALAETHLDIDGIVRAGVDAALASEDVLREIQRFPAAAVLLALGGTSGGGDALRTLLATEAKEYVRHGVVSGAFAGKPEEGASTYAGMFGKAFRGGGKDRKSFGPVTVTRRGADTARLATSLVDGGKKRVYPLDLVAVRRDGVWRIVEVANLPELFGLRADKEGK